MTLEMDEVDFNFVCRVLAKAKATFEDRMMDTSLSEPFRNHFRESAKMANTARDIMFDAKHDGEKKGGAE